MAGRTAPGFRLVAEAFTEVVAGQPGTGAALAIWRDGELVVDLWGGWADAARTRRWQADSIVMPYSVSKAFVAVCALRLVDQGRLDLDAPVHAYWPGFESGATVRQLLSHQAGVVALDDQQPTEVFYDWNRLCGLLASQPPAFPPGTAHGESALFYGHLVGEVVRRVDGRGPGRFLREEICDPLGLDFAFGLSASEQRRAAELTGVDALRESQRAQPELPDLYWRALDNPPGLWDPHVVNGAAWRAAEVPAVNGHGTARAVTGLYAALLSGDLLSPALLAEATSAQCEGVDRVFGQDVAWGLGFGVDHDGFGMGGLGGSSGIASTSGGYAFAFLTGSLGEADRGLVLENAFRSCLGLAELA